MVGFTDLMLPASWNGVPFYVESDAFKTGRRHVVHQYPYRNNPWVEDMGRDTQIVTFNGFMVGDLVIVQRLAMQLVCERKGAGILTHPHLGIQRAYLVSAIFGVNADKGRVVSVQFEFIIADSVLLLWPIAGIASQDASLTGADNLDSAASGDFFSKVGSFITGG